MKTICAVLVSAALATAADPVFLRRDLAEVRARSGGGSSSYAPLFGAGDADAGQLRTVARYGEVTVAPGGSSPVANDAAEEQIVFVTEGAGTLLYGGRMVPIRRNDFAYIPPGVPHSLGNESTAPLRVILMGYRIPAAVRVQPPPEPMIANADEVGLQVLGQHGPTTQFKLLMGLTSSKRDKLAAARVMDSLFLMDFAPGGTNIPHKHPAEEEIYLLLRGSGEMVAGLDASGKEVRYPVHAGEAFFFKPGTQVGYYSHAREGQPHDLILAARSRLAAALETASAPVHVWEKQELTFTAARDFANPYTDAAVWVDLTGPSFKKRIYGFWDGGRTFKVRLTATEPGAWTWQSGSTPPDEGLAGKSGSFEAAPWTEAEKQQNPLRRGFVRATANHHALQYADGTPFFILGDTWWAAGTNCFQWYDGDEQRALGPTAGFKDYVRYRKAQGFNLVGIIAAFPNWANDGKPAHIVMDNPEHTVIRSAWLEFGADSAKNMDNEGGRPFLYPGRVPGYEDVFADVDRINPRYFDYLDRKLDYLNQQGFVPFIEVSRRDASQAWKRYYPWPDSYARFVEYIFARYQANNALLSPIHFDTAGESIPASEFEPAIEMALRQHGRPPFGSLLTGNPAPSTLLNWGDGSWVTLHQIGNSREHDFYWYLTQIFRAKSPQPALNGEPYYSGYYDARGRATGYPYGAQGNTPKDDQFVRSGMYGSFLSGGLAGHIYGAEGIWGADVQPAAPVKMWDAFQWSSAAQMRHLRTFAFSIGRRYQDLIPDADWVTPNRTATTRGYEGWSYAAHTADAEIVMAYFEKGCAQSSVRALKPSSVYRAEWFDPRTGEFQDAGGGFRQSNAIGAIALPPFPADADWALRLRYAGPAYAAVH